MEYQQLVKLANEIKDKAYAPYSHFRVGAALLTKSGKVFRGVNIENASFGATNCAERTAIFKAVSEGELEFSAIAISSDSEDKTFPCGICRQVIVEFCDENVEILCSNKHGDYNIYTVKELLPHAFQKNALENLKENNGGME